MPDFPFGAVVDPRDVTREAEADQVRVDVWEGLMPGHGGMCTSYAVPTEDLAAALAWRLSNPTVRVDIGITVRLNDEVVLVKIAGPSRS